MIIPQYQVDAFATRVFQGNPAAVCPLEQWLDDSLMQSIAAENNLAETVFFVKTEDQYAIRWFTPTTEVPLCGHATLASAYILFNHLGVNSNRVSFDSLSGVLHVDKKGDLLEMDFPSEAPVVIPIPQGLEDALGVSVKEVLFNQYHVVVLESEQTVKELAPDLSLLSKVDCRGVIVTSVSSGYDFVCRFFAPNMGIDEDPVTGSAFTKLVPFWAKKLDKTVFKARQVSARGGDVNCELHTDRVKISGSAVLFSEGEIHV